MILPLETLQGLTDRPGQVTYINVILDRTSDRSVGVAAGASLSQASEVVEAIQAIDRRLLALTTSGMFKPTRECRSPTLWLG